MTAYAKDTVVLLHGLARSSRSMGRIEVALNEEGYRVLNIDYPSRKFCVEIIAEIIARKVSAETIDSERIHFVTHSMGGILIRYIQKHFPLDKLARVVMLSPPNHGSEIVDKLGNFKVFEWLNGPAGLQLGTSQEGLISKLGPTDFELGIITGDRSINLILSCMISGRNDGKVSIESAKVEGMSDFKIVHVTHPYIMKNTHVIRDISSFLKVGKFERT